jgi:asparagine synthase (glutamine-hydrolysing)
MSRVFRILHSVYSAVRPAVRVARMTRGVDNQMCGVVGLLTHGGGGLGADLDAMSAAVAHRGPDDVGRWLDRDAGVALGHRRLSIVDLSAAGHQPMTSADGRWVLVLNGEIYDHADHRARLEGDGVAFRGHSDTEVLVELIARRGPEAAVAAVDGMFALAAWDRRDRVLVLARDRVGRSRCTTAGSATLSRSPPSSAPSVGSRTRAPAPTRRPWLTTCGTASSQHRARSSRGSTSSRRVVSCGSRARRQSRSPCPTGRWHRWPPQGSPTPWHSTTASSCRLADAALRESVRRRLEADVPVGTFLSGGVDSSTIVALAQAVSTQPVRTFTVAVGGEGDESVPLPGSPDTWAPSTPRCPWSTSTRSTWRRGRLPSMTSRSPTPRACRPPCSARRPAST